MDRHEIRLVVRRRLQSFNALTHSVGGQRVEWEDAHGVIPDDLACLGVQISPLVLVGCATGATEDLVQLGIGVTHPVGIGAVEASQGVVRIASSVCCVLQIHVPVQGERSEERRVGKEGRSAMSTETYRQSESRIATT